MFTILLSQYLTTRHSILHTIDELRRIDRKSRPVDWQTEHISNNLVDVSQERFRSECESEVNEMPAKKLTVVWRSVRIILGNKQADWVVVVIVHQHINGSFLFFYAPYWSLNHCNWHCLRTECEHVWLNKGEICVLMCLWKCVSFSIDYWCIVWLSELLL